HPVFEEMVLDIANVTLVKRSDGTTNASAFEANVRHEDDTARPPSSSPGKDVLVHRLELKIDRLVIVDFTLLDPTPKEYTLNLKSSYTEVTRLDQLFEPAVLKNLAPVAAAVSVLVSGDLGAVLAEAGKSGNDWLKDTGRKTGERAKGFFDALEESKKP
ncbi:MAG: hypothetical protein ABIV50_15030, partial [Opitutus sp.]